MGAHVMPVPGVQWGAGGWAALRAWSPPLAFRLCLPSAPPGLRSAWIPFLQCAWRWSKPSGTCQDLGGAALLPLDYLLTPYTFPLLTCACVCSKDNN